MAKTYLGKKLQELGHVETVVPEDKIVIVKEKDEGTLSLSEFFFYVKENLDFSNYVTIKDARETYARKDSVYTKDVTDAKYAFIDRVYTRTMSDDKYAVKGSTHSKEYIDSSFPLRDEVYPRELTYSKQEAFNIFALKTELPILPDLRPYTTTVDGDKRWANINTSYSKVQTDGLYPLKANTYTKLESDDLYATKANTYTKDEAEVRYLNVEEGYNRTFINSNFYYKTDLYTRDESNTRFPRRDEVYTIAAVNDQFASKSWVYSRAEALTTFPLITNTYTKTNVNTLIETRAGQTETELRTGYYSKIDSDGRYPNKADVYTKAQSDNQYAPRGTSLTEEVIRQDYYMRDVIDNKFASIDFSPYLKIADAVITYAPKTTVYTKDEADAKYHKLADTKLTVSSTIANSAKADLGFVIENKATATTSGTVSAGQLSFVAEAKQQASVYSRRISTKQEMILEVAAYGTAPLTTLSISSTGLTHTTYGNLHDYFAKASESYKRTEIDTKLSDAANLVYTKTYIDANTYTRTVVDSKDAAITTAYNAAIIAHAYTKAQTDATYATKATLTADYALKSLVYTKVDTDNKFVTLTKYDADLAVISNDNYLGLVLNGHAKNSGRVGVSNLQVAVKSNGERIIELIDPTREAVLASNIKPRLDSKLVLNTLVRYKNNPTVTPSVRVAFRYFDELDTELKLVNLPDSTKTYTLSRSLTVGDVLLFTTSYDTLKLLKTPAAFIMNADLTLRKVSSNIAYPPSGTPNWWDGLNQVSRGNGATEAQAILRTPWNMPNPDRQDGVWPAGTVISIQANPSEADVNAPLLYYTVNASNVATIPWATITERMQGLVGTITTDSTRSYTAYESLRLQVSIIPQTNALEFVTIALEHLSQTDFESLKSQYYTKVNVDADFIRKSDYSDYGYTKALVYTKVEGDARYYTKSDVYTKVQTDALIAGVVATASANLANVNAQINTITTTYATTAAVASAYYTKSSATALETSLKSYADGVGTSVTSTVATNYYTKTQGDARYHQVTSKALTVAATDGYQTSLISNGLSFSKDGGPGSTLTRELVNNAYILTFNGYYGPSSTTKGDYIRVATDGIWAVPYGNLHDYFAKSSETYTKAETYAKGEVYTKTEANNLYIAKSITTLKLTKFEVDYTSTTLAATTQLGLNFNIPGNVLSVRATSTGTKAGVSFTTSAGVKFFTADVDGNIFSNGVNIDTLYADKADTYVKSEVDSKINILKADTMGVAALNQKFDDIYTKAAVNSAFLSKSDATSIYLSKTGANVYLTTATAQSTYALSADTYSKSEVYTKGDVYTKSQSDTNYYTKALADARYVNYTDPLVTVTNTGTSAYTGGFVIAHASGTNDTAGSLVWTMNGVRSAMWYNQGASTGESKMNLYLRHTDTVWQSAFNVTTSRIWHKTYGYLDDYFAKSAEYYSKVEADARYYTKTDTYTKSEVNAFNTSNNTALGLRYTKVETDAKFYDKTEADARYYTKSDVYVKADVYTKAQSDVNYYTKSVADARYEYMGVAYTKAQTDARFYDTAQADARYHQKSVTYTRLEADDRYLLSTGIPEITGNTTSTYSMGLLLRNSHATATTQGGIQWYNKTVRTGLMYLYEPTTADKSSRLGIYLNNPTDGVNQSTMWVDQSGIWHKVYGMLDTYFATASDTYSKSEVYTKAEADAKYPLKTASYTKAESDAKYALNATYYSKTETDARFYDMTQANARYALKTDSYTKSESEARYTNVGVSYTKAESDAKYALSATYYSKTESDGRYYTKAVGDARYEYMGVAYTKAESDVRYFKNSDSLLRVEGNSTSGTTIGLTIHNTRAAESDGGNITWLNENKVTAVITTSGGATTDSTLHLQTRTPVGATANALTLTTTQMVHSTYGALHTYFAIADDVYAKTLVYSKSEADARYPLKSASYTKAEGDARYVNYTDQLVKFTGNQTDTYKLGLEINNDHTTTDAGSSILWNIRGVRSAMWYVTGGSVTASQMNLYLRHTDAVWQSAFNVTTSRIWHKTYGYLDSYFAKSAEYYSKTEADARYYTKSDVYTKSEAEARYTNVGVSYTKAEGDARYEPINTMYTKAESDARYEPINTMYTKAESDARYAKVWTGTQASYNSITTKDTNTIYLIT